jgi:alpha-glucosidase (family GH31 glycosyl hydrolase)
MAETMTLIHTPLGIEHPYEQNFLERYPRFPTAGEAVTLGAATTPAGKADSVVVTWKVKGKVEEGRANGICEIDDDDNSFWKLRLPAFTAGNIVSYQLFARSGKELIKTGTYQFEVLDWIEIGDLVDYCLQPSFIELFCSSKLAGRNSFLRISFPDNHRLRFHLEMGISEELKSESHSNLKSAIVETTAAQQPFLLIEENKECIILKSKRLQLIINRHPCRLEILHEDGSRVLSESESMKWLVGAGGKAKEVRQVFVCPQSEAFFGFGERFNALNQRGNTLDVRVFEQYKNQGPRTYLPVPFFISSEGYGAYFDTSHYLSYDLGASNVKCWSFQAELDLIGSLEYELIVDHDPKGILGTFASLTSLPTFPPSWAFGPWMSSNEWNSQATVLEQVKRTLELDIPVSVMVIEAWSDETTFYIWNDSQYTPKPADQPFTLGDFTFSADGKWPNPKKMIDELHRQGIRLLLWQIPALKSLGSEQHAQQEIDEAYMLEKDYCLRWPDGSPYRVRPFWFHDSLLLDFNNPSAVEWWMSKRAYLLDELSVDGFKTDGGEHLWGKDVVFANGLRGDEGLNLYPNLYVGAYHRFVSRKRNGDALTFSRAGFTGAQSFPCHWAGDENSTWEAFRASLNAGLSAGLSGIPFWGWDIAGFSGEIPSAELYLRATAMATFCPIMQYHSEFNDHRMPSRDRTPWNIAERTGCNEVIDICRQYTHLRMRLLPYITAEACHCAETGEPLMRPLFLDWPDDPQALQVFDQYCFGRSLLVSPVLQPGATDRRLYLPAGQWLDYWTGTEYKGQQWVTIPAPLERIPVFRRLDQAWTPLL